MTSFGRSQLLIQQDPGLNRRFQLADSLRQQGLDTSPVQHPLQALARVLQGFVGGRAQAGAEKEFRDRQDRRRQSLADALSGRPAQTVEDPSLTSDDLEGNFTNTTQSAQAPDFKTSIAKLLANPDTADIGAQLQLGQIGRQQTFQDQADLTRLKAGLKKPVPGRDVPLAPNVLAQKKELAIAGRNQNIGTIPPGFQAKTDASGNTLMVPIPGSPADTKKTQAEQQKAQRKLGEKRQADVVLQDIDRVFDKMKSATMPTTGFFGDLVSNIGGTASGDIRASLNTIKANVGFDKLQQMREASPTGGALGQVSEMENRLLQSVLGNLEQSQSEEQFSFNLKRLNNLYLDIIHGPGEGPKRMSLGNQSQSLPGNREDLEKLSDDEVLKRLGVR